MILKKFLNQISIILIIILYNSVIYNMQLERKINTENANKYLTLFMNCCEPTLDNNAQRNGIIEALRDGANINTKNKDGYYPIFYFLNDNENLNFIIQQNPIIYIQTSDICNEAGVYQLPIIKLINQRCKPEHFETIIKFCANIDSEVTIHNDTLLSYILSHLHTDPSINPDITNRQFCELLAQYICILINYGANPHKLNTHGQSAYIIAKSSTCERIHKLKRLFFEMHGVRKDTIKESLDKSLIPDLTNIVWQYLYSKN